ncbi:hypothetical protein TRIUR3_22078 [Triticum urartu]|uniref:Uncharacterized protein n=1 Tax=Triticum urartu TaxID=4572 RepID=M7YVZ4_TRIUA|nr:hypothetical protein TRIUR3_22078 [Triticum urartu]
MNSTVTGPSLHTILARINGQIYMNSVRSTVRTVLCATVFDWSLPTHPPQIPSPSPPAARWIRRWGATSDVTVIPDWVGDLGESVGPVDYGCVRRCRHRRLATYLWLHGFRDALRGLLNETDAYMSVIHLSRLVRQGLWDDAIAYVSRFLRPVSHPQSDEAQVLLHFLKHHAPFASMVAGVPDRNLTYFNRKYNTRYLKHDHSVSHDALRIRSIVLSILHLEQVRSSLDWERVRWKASQIVKHLAYKAPELKGLVILPGGSTMPHDVLPIGFRYRRRRHVKEQDLPRPKTLAKIFLRTKKRYIWQQAVRPFDFTISKNLSDHAYESLQAGLELQSSGKEGVPGAPVLNTMSGTATHLTKNSGASSLTNAAPGFLLPILTARFVAGANYVSIFTTCAEVSSISSVTNPGALAASVSQTVLRTLESHQ